MTASIAATIRAVPRARPGPVTDHLLRDYIQTATDLRGGCANAEAVAALCHALPELLGELLHRRQAMDLMGNLTEIDNVTFLPTEAG